MPKFNVNIDIFWVDLIFLVNFFTKCIPLLLIFENEQVASVWSVYFDWLLNFKVAFFNELILIFIKLYGEGKWCLLNVDLFPLLWIQSHKISINLRINFLIFNEFTQMIIVDSKLSLVELRTGDESYFEGIDITVNLCLWWSEFRRIWHSFYLFGVTHNLEALDMLQDTLKIVSIFDLLQMFWLHFRQVYI